MKNLQTLVVALFILLPTTNRVIHADEGFRLSDLNPFATKKTTPTPDTPPEQPTKKSYLPTLPTFNLMPQAKPGQPSTWQRINNGTTSFFSNTWKTLTFQNTGTVSPQARRITGSQRVYDGSPSRSKTRAKKSGGLRSFFESKSEPDDSSPKKPTDFLKQPRVPIE